MLSSSVSTTFIGNLYVTLPMFLSQERWVEGKWSDSDAFCCLDTHNKRRFWQKVEALPGVANFSEAGAAFHFPRQIIFFVNGDRKSQFFLRQIAVAYVLTGGGKKTHKGLRANPPTSNSHLAPPPPPHLQPIARFTSLGLIVGGGR